MTRLLSAIAIGLALTACSADQSHDGDKATATAPSTQSESNSATTILADTTKVKTWLINVIEAYPNGEDPNLAFQNLKKSLTNDYYHYKQDAISLEYADSDTAMTEDEFKKKWQAKYDVKFVGNGGFIISAQDNGKIKVTRCRFIKSLGQYGSLYKVRIEDLDYKLAYHRDIKVVATANQLFIDDVVEYD